MYISRIKLYNWKNFHDCEVVLSERCFIVGANATGKSNFLDVIRFMRDIVKQGGGLQAAVALRGGLKKIRCLAARQSCLPCWTAAALFFWQSRRRICILLSLRQYRSLLPRCSATRKDG